MGAGINLTPEQLVSCPCYRGGVLGCYDCLAPTLVVQRSQAACNKHADRGPGNWGIQVNYGCASKGKMYVDDGCRGKFRCGSQEVECASWGFQRAECDCPVSCE